MAFEGQIGAGRGPSGGGGSGAGGNGGGSGRRRPESVSWRQRLLTLSHLPRLFAQVWRTSPGLLLASLLLRLARAVQAPAVLYTGKRIVDVIVALTHSATPTSALADWWAEGRLTPLAFWLGVEFGLVILFDVLGRAASVVDSTLSELHANKLTVELMTHAASLDLLHFESAEYQDKLERARRQAAGRNVLLSQLFSQAQDILTVVILVSGLALYEPWLILLLALALGPAVAGESYFNRLSYHLTHERTPERREMDYLRYTGASVEGAKEIKLFDLGGFLVARFGKLAHRLYLDNRNLAIRRASWGALFAAIGTVTYYFAYALIAWRTVRGDFSVGDLTFLAGSFMRLHSLLEQVMIGVAQLTGQTLYLDDLFSFFDIQPNIRSPAQPKPFPAPLRQGIEFENVGFRYPESDRWAMRGLNFTLKAGETLALVGENGAGKTTIVKLLTRLYDPDEGRILIDGIDLRDFELSDLRAHIGVIFQDFMRYNFTAADNIGVGRVAEMRDHLRVREAARRSLADRAIAKLPLGYEQPLGKRFTKGLDLSGGEWQKLAIARGYMRDADLLILDEPTAALDARAEAEIFERFKGLGAGKTAILISHRFSTVRMADHILVLDGGKVTEEGSHAELMAQGGHYAELFELQATGYR